jgi:ATP-GRASP peptide maturase of grasp-with-spasm system
MKYVLISSISDDKSTSDVIEWLNYFNIPVVRINENDEIILNEFNIDNNSVEFSIQIKGKKNVIRLSEIAAYWYRRGDIRIKNKITKNGSEHVKKIENLLFMENNFLHSTLHYCLSSYVPICLNSKNDNFTNKLTNLIHAKNFGLEIPNTLITTKWKNIKKIKSNSIIKSIGFNEINFSDQILMQQKTELKNKDSLVKTFFPTLFQNNIEKLFEIRSFYLDEEFYSIAIFSQSDKKTELDFRNYNRERPNRTPPYNLPVEIKKKLIKLMNKLDMKSGSIDLIFTKESKYVFLEVNPIGQFMQVSIPGNFCLEKKIAMFLSSKQIIDDKI